jgi:hypothetical protein
MPESVRRGISLVLKSWPGTLTPLKEARFSSDASIKSSGFFHRDNSTKNIAVK